MAKGVVKMDVGTRVAIRTAYILGATHGVCGGLLQTTDDIIPAVSEKLAEINDAG